MKEALKILKKKEREKEKVKTLVINVYWIICSTSNTINNHCVALVHPIRMEFSQLHENGVIVAGVHRNDIFCLNSTLMKHLLEVSRTQTAISGLHVRNKYWCVVGLLAQQWTKQL